MSKNHFHCSDGTRVSKTTIDRKTREAKRIKLLMQIEDIGFNRCEQCKRNDCVPVDVSHIISVDTAQKSGRAELCWDTDNMTILGRNCHRKRDKAYISNGKR